MGCGGSDEKKQPENPLRSEQQDAKDPEKVKCASEIVEGLDTNNDGLMQFEEVQVLVKNLHPRFTKTPPSAIGVNEPEMARLNGMSRQQLIDHLATTVDKNWLEAFHQFLGLSGDPEKALNKSWQPGVYKVTWEGGVQYRKSNNYMDVYYGEETADGTWTVPIAQKGQHYRIQHFVQGVMVDKSNRRKKTEVWYGYLEWPRLFLPMTFPSGKETMARESDYENTEQLDRMAESLFKKIVEKEKKDTQAENAPTSVEPEKIINFLNLVRIGYDEEAIAERLNSSDANKDGKIDVDEFKECFRTKCIADCIWVDTNGKVKVPHPESVAAHFEKSNNQDEDYLLEGEQM